MGISFRSQTGRKQVRRESARLLAVASETTKGRVIVAATESLCLVQKVPTEQQLISYVGQLCDEDKPADWLARNMFRVHSQLQTATVAVCSPQTL